MFEVIFSVILGIRIVVIWRGSRVKVILGLEVFLYREVSGVLSGDGVFVDYIIGVGRTK